MAQPEIVDIAEIISELGLSGTITDSDEALLYRKKVEFEQACRTFCRHNITQPTTDYTHFLPSDDRFEEKRELLDVVGDKVTFDRPVTQGHILQLPQIFARTITTVHEDQSAYAGVGSGDFAAGTLLTEGTDYYLDLDESGLSLTGHLFRIGGNWSTRARTIKVVYNAGFTAAELDSTYTDLKAVVIEGVRRRFNMAKSQQGSTGKPGPIKSESIGRGEYAVTYAIEKVPIAGLAEDEMSMLSEYVNWGRLT